jgi:hypothetical protein
MEYLWPFLGLFAYVAVPAAVFTLARRWPRVVRSLLGTLIVGGAVLLGWAASQGIGAEKGGVHYDSPAAETAFRIGLALTSIAAALFLMGLPQPDPRWEASPKGVVKDIGVRVVGTWVLCGVIGCGLFTVVTGYVK